MPNNKLIENTLDRRSPVLTTDVVDMHFSVQSVTGYIPSLNSNPLRGVICSVLAEHGIDGKSIPHRINGLSGISHKRCPDIVPSRNLWIPEGSSFSIRCKTEDVDKFSVVSGNRMLDWCPIAIANPEVAPLTENNNLYCYCFYANGIEDPSSMARFISNKLKSMDIDSTVAMGDRKVIKISFNVVLAGFSVRLLLRNSTDSIRIKSVLDGSFGAKGHYGCGFWV
jgi:hypothetical protein